MSRHNRRRTRGGYRAAQYGVSSPAGTSSPIINPGLMGYPSPPSLPSYASSLVLPRGLIPISKGGYTSTASARTWYSQYTVLQEYKQMIHEEEAKLIAYKKQIFGPAGDEDSDSGSGEDDELCEKMMVYFEGLDFVKP